VAVSKRSPTLTSVSTRALTLTTSTSWLELDSKFCGFPKSIEGGDITGDVAVFNPPGGGIPTKRIANVRYEDLVLAFGADMSDSPYDWIAATLSRTYTPKVAAIVVGDMNGREISRLEFTDALLREIKFPALDASSKDAAAIEIKLTSHQVRRKAGAGESLAANTQTKKQWLVSDFRLQIDGLDCTRVDSIDALTISLDLPPDPLGIKESTTRPPVLNIPNLSFTIPESAAASLIAWRDDFLINGHHLNADEKNGSLQFLAANLEDVIFTLTFHHMGIFSLKKVDTDVGSTPRLHAEMYCDEIAFEYSAQASGTNTSSGTADGSTDLMQNVGRPPLRGASMQGLANTAGPIAGLEPSRLIAANAPNLGRPLKFRT
jgi:hypothetical protein